MPKRLIYNLAIIGTTALLVFSSCYEKKEGCLDISAKNYDFGADEPCSDCCVYPTFKLGISHLWGDTTLKHNSFYLNSFGQYIKIIEAKFYISEVSLRKNNAENTINETINVRDLSGNISTIPDDFIFVQTSRFTYPVGTFNSGREFDGISFTLGISGNFSALDEKDSFVEEDNFFSENTFIHTNIRMKYVVDSIKMDTLQWSLENFDTSLNFKLDAEIELPLGKDFVIPLKADYKKLLFNVNFLELVNGLADENIQKNLSDFIHN